MAFGCGRNNQGTFADADGLIGLGQGALSLPSQLSPSIAKIFSYCLVDQYNATTPSSSPITFGNAAEHSNVTYTPLLMNVNNPSFYYVEVTGVTVGRHRVNTPPSAFRIDSNGNGGVILDSGTTISSWRQAAFDQILAVLSYLHSLTSLTAPSISRNFLKNNIHRVLLIEVMYVPVVSIMRNLVGAVLPAADCIS